MSPRPDIHCKENISDLSVCDTDQKEMAIDENYCLSVDHHGHPVDIYSKIFKPIACELLTEFNLS